jgi:glycosyltransferase involved in cell wall biosynthesis
MRVLHVLEATWGGTRTHVLDLLPRLQARGWECGLVYSSRRHAAFVRDAAWLEAQGIRTWHVPMARSLHPALDAQALRSLSQVVSAFEPGLLHAHSSKAGLLARLQVLAGAPRQRPPVVYTPHCVAFDTLLPVPQRRAARWVEQLLAPLTSRTIAVSLSEARALRRVLGLADCRVNVVPNGLDATAFDRAASPSKLPPHVPTIGCFGRLSPQKNQRVLLRALKYLHQGGTRANLLMVGGGEDEAPLRALAAQWGLQEHVRWMGDVEDARPFYAQCDVVAQPSLWEGCPYSLLEAMAARRAILATDLAPLREMLPPECACGVLAPARAEEFASSLRSLLEDAAARREMGAHAREHLESQFSLERMIEGTLRTYHDALKSRA